ncbi:KTSC domain-containing protein [Actinoallomurus bryophytorum]|uniref:KTSC domain-containing protein n=1 Tax=Actinoallomurus bryophytorum TaxID=1490222 RepID=A0A543CG97_9ACTN|nr:KTSC domain-containing protein [Actinoallomurus bryophytorum]TQL96133.1 KTSC domain-containing protein [Actinoallomurus bryophytorum]
MVLTPISSSHLLAAGYDSTTRTLSVQFKGGEIYQYFEVPGSIYEEMVRAQPHPWSAVNRTLRAGYAYRRLS